MSESIYHTHKPESGGGGLYLKIADGEAVKLRIASEPAIFQTESKPDEQGNTRISTRYAWTVWNQDEQLAQIFQQSATFFKQIAGLAQDDEWGDPMEYDIKVKREGQGLDTTYSVTPSAQKVPLSAEAQQAVDSIDLLSKLESPYSQHVMWLAEAENGGAKKSIPGSNSKPQSSGRMDDVIAEVGDEPINLDEIPF